METQAQLSAVLPLKDPNVRRIVTMFGFLFVFDPVSTLSQHQPAASSRRERIRSAGRSTGGHRLLMRILVVLSALVSGVIGHAQEILRHGDLLYRQDGKSITITGYSGRPQRLSVPVSINGRPVTAIGDFAFRGCASLGEVQITWNVEWLGTSAFELCGALTNLVIGDGVEVVDPTVFRSCTGLTTVTLGTRFATPETLYLSACPGLESVTVAPENPYLSSPDGVLYNKLGTRILSYPRGRVGAYRVPDAVTDMGSISWAGCVGLDSITFGVGISNIQSGMFRACTNLVTVCVPDGVTSVGAGAFEACSALRAVRLGSGIQTIAPRLFYGCRSLAALDLPPTITSVGDSAFEGCTSLANIAIPNAVLSIGTSAFQDCAGLRGVTFGSGLETIGSFAFIRCGALGRVEFPRSLRTIGVEAFGSCSSMVEALMPSRVEAIDLRTFVGCSNLVRVQLPDGLRRIGNQAFRFNHKLVGVSVPGSVTNIESLAFAFCPSLESVVLPKSLAGLGRLALSDCPRLTAVYCLGTAPSELGEDLFQNTPSAVVYRKAEAAGWGATFAGRPVVIWDGVVPFEVWAGSSGLTHWYSEQSRPQDDADGDGMPNVDEMIAGTDPIRAGSVLCFETQPRPEDLSAEDQGPLADGQIAFYLRTVPGRTYRLLHADSPTRGSWRDAGGPVIATTAQKRVVVPARENGNGTMGFYRIVAEP